MTLKTLAPVLTTEDMDRSIRFYVDVLGFTCGMQTPGYSNLCRDAVRIMLAAPNAHVEWKGPNFLEHAPRAHRPHLRPVQERHALHRPDQVMGARFRASLTQDDQPAHGMDQFSRRPAAGADAVWLQGRGHRLLRAERDSLSRVRARPAEADHPELRGQLRLHAATSSCGQSSPDTPPSNRRSS
jgi:catechol 2,3-dioxygenase-like lactoylglutathione lyase family enzyme